MDHWIGWNQFVNQFFCQYANCQISYPYFFMIFQLDKLRVPRLTSSTARLTKGALLTTRDVTSMMTVGMAQMKTRRLVVKKLETL